MSAQDYLNGLRGVLQPAVQEAVPIPPLTPVPRNIERDVLQFASSVDDSGEITPGAHTIQVLPTGRFNRVTVTWIYRWDELPAGNDQFIPESSCWLFEGRAFATQKIEWEGSKLPSSYRAFPLLGSRHPNSQQGLSNRTSGEGTFDLAESDRPFFIVVRPDAPQHSRTEGGLIHCAFTVILETIPK